MASEIEFRWIDWNLDHATVHGCAIEEIESVVRTAGRGWPRKIGDGKRAVEGRGQGGRMVRVVYLIDPEGTFFVIHAMPLTTRRRR
jgi:phage-related protein